MKSSTILKFTTIFFLAIISFMGCFKLLVNNIYHKMDCQSFNIDHIEIRTGINIPKTTFADCEMDDDQSYRKATFNIDSERVDINTWLADNKFKESGNLFINSGQKKDHKWIAEFNPEELRLTVDINYKI